jgi:hypothetical protein
MAAAKLIIEQPEIQMAKNSAIYVANCFDLLRLPNAFLKRPKIQAYVPQTNVIYHGRHTHF